jgi:NitT/TauT family transport system substrate-binding protein
MPNQEMFVLKKMRFRQGLLSVCAACALFMGSTTAKAGTPFTLGAVQWIGYGPIYVALDQGYFAKNGLDVKIVNFDDNASMPGAVYAGQVDAATLTYDQVIGANANGWNLKVVQPIDYSAGADAIVATTAITSIPQIKGMKVAYAPLSPSDFLLGYALHKYGMTEADVTSVNSPAEGVASIMAGGSTDVGVTYEPTVSAIVQSGGGSKFHVIFSSKEAPGLITDVITVNEKLIKNHPEEISAFLKSFIEGEAFMKAHPDQANGIIGKAIGVSASDAAAQLAGVQNPTLAEMPSVLTESDKLPSFYVTGPVIGKLLLSEKQIKTMPPIAGTIDASFVNAALAGK